MVGKEKNATKKERNAWAHMPMCLSNGKFLHHGPQKHKAKEKRALGPCHQMFPHDI